MTPEWIGILISIAVALISVGAARAQLAGARAQIRRLERSAEQQGGRIGNLEADMMVAFDRIGAKRTRRPTAAGGVVAGPVHDGGSDDDQ